METYLVYIGKAAIGAGAFYIAYLLLFQHQKHFGFNRIYLPVSLALSFMIPLITFTTVKYIEPVNFDVNSFAYLASASGETVQPEFVLEWYHYLFGLYLLGTAGFLFHLLLGHLKAIKIVKQSSVLQKFGATVNVTKKDVHPFSFFSKIVIAEKTLSHPELEMIVSHEKIHVREKHTLDILFTEIMFLLQWFNPFAWLLKDAVKNNLEYLTDHEIVKKFNAQEYQLAMVSLAGEKGVAPFLTALNGSQLKNRIIMMKKKTENKFAIVKQLAVLPLLAILVMGLSNKEVKTEVLKIDPEKNIQIQPEQSVINNLPAADTVAKAKEIVVVGYGVAKEENPAEGGYSISGGMNGTMQKGSENVTITPSTQNGLTIKSGGDPAKQPLFIVDGKEVKGIENLNPEEIEKIDVLKDKSSTAVYGDKGKNGVILITTKKQKKKFQPLMIINGKESTQKFEDIAPGTIQSMNSLTGDAATKKYGEKGKNGVIEVTLKTELLSAELELRELFAQELKYPYEALASKSEGVQIFPILIDSDGNIGSAFTMDLILPEIVVENNTAKDVNFISGKVLTSEEERNIFANEFNRVKEKISKIDIDELKGKSIGVQIRFKNNSLEAKTEKEKQTILDLRSKIARTIKYPVLAQENNQQGVVEIWSSIEKDGTISRVTDKRPDGKFINVDEVVVTSYKSEKAVTSEKSKDLSLLVKESIRVIEQLSPLNIPELQGEMVCFRMKFVLQ